MGRLIAPRQACHVWRGTIGIAIGRKLRNIRNVQALAEM
jgi:hypothetical protein